MTGQDFHYNFYADTYHSSTLTVIAGFGDGSSWTGTFTGVQWSCTFGNGVCFDFYIVLHHAYAATGTYTLTVTIVDSQSYNAVNSVPITVNPPTTTSGWGGGGGGRYFPI